MNYVIMIEPGRILGEPASTARVNTACTLLFISPGNACGIHIPRAISITPLQMDFQGNTNSVGMDDVDKLLAAFQPGQGSFDLPGAPGCVVRTWSRTPPSSPPALRPEGINDLHVC